MFPRKPSLVAALLPLYAVVFGLLGLGTGIQIGKRSAGDGAAKVGDALDRIQKRWYGEVAPGALLDAAVEGMASKLDPYCEYYTAQEYKDFEDQHMRGQFGGVGIIVGSDPKTGFMTVETPIEDSPAFAADILPGDQIREVDGASIKGQPLQDVVRKIKGEPGTPVTLTMSRKGREQLFKVTLTRKIIVVKAVKPKMLNDGVGYIRISDFTEMMEQFDAAVKDLQAKGMTSMVIDLRFNGGGLLTECIALSDRFLDAGVIVTTRGKTPEDLREASAKKGDTLPPMPLVVLVNQSTASASEIFAGAMKDHGRGTLVGTRTFGKGSVQTPFTLSDGSHLKLTTARYFTPKGTSVHKEEGKKDYGLDPDFLIEMSQEEESALMRTWNDERIVKGERPPIPEGFKDHQLEAGLEVLKAKMQNRDPKVEARVLKKDKPSEN
ncbi:MAG TPA: S41 family peptidase [Planctomycetota bacterium]